MALVAPLALSACGSKPLPPPKPPVLVLQLDAKPNVNPNTAGRASPVQVRIYELKSAAAFEASDFVTLFERDSAVLGADLISRDEFMLKPGESKTLRRELGPASRFIAVMAAYRDIERGRWRTVTALTAGSDAVMAVRLDASTLQTERRP